VITFDAIGIYCKIITFGITLLKPGMSKKILRLLIIDDNSPFVLPYLRSFSDCPEIKLYVVISTDQEPTYFRYSRYLKTFYKVESFTPDNFMAIVKDCIEKSSADLIISMREWISKLIYQHNEELSELVKIHPVSAVKTIDTILDKWKLNCWLKMNSFPYSNAIQMSTETETNNAFDQFSYPVLLKPVTGIGGIGIKMMDSKENLKIALTKDKLYAKNYFIQEYINGYDIDLSFFAIDGKILFHTIQKGFISDGLTYSKGIEFLKNKELLELTSDIVSKLKYSGIAHLDFRYDSKNQKYTLIDFNARYWSSVEGSRIMGVNFPVLAVGYTMGTLITFPDYKVGTFYFGTTAIKTVVRNLYSKTKHPINLRNTELRFMLLDPLPEVVHSVKKLKSILIGKFRKKSQSVIVFNFI
jgi:predicted ATP-grasp superfamily ATP-dependent carboligase